MKGNRAIVAVVVIIVIAVAGWWVFKRSARGASVDLISTFDTAVKEPAGGRFEVVTADVNGESKRAVSTTSSTRVKWKVHVPDDAWLKVSVGMPPDTWDKEGDGVVFYVGVSDGRAYEQLLSQHLDPFTNKGDRRWVAVTADLSAYAGEDVELIFNTRASAQGKPEDGRNDIALWGAPEVVIR